MHATTIKLDKLQLEHENEWVALDSATKEILGSNPSLKEIMGQLSEDERKEGPIFFKVPTSEASLSPTGYEI